MNNKEELILLMALNKTEVELITDSLNDTINGIAEAIEHYDSEDQKNELRKYKDAYEELFKRLEDGKSTMTKDTPIVIPATPGSYVERLSEGEE